ncbi:unnamed protein product [Mytilus coruscus]|uniref:MAM domain-containing protein n=1 Tax=Mytilus coruscus TaxID=42192 RepID=A0A6J8BZM3_MYTCO|nr:unnamed protein product [Mytilus coruscus]
MDERQNVVSLLYLSFTMLFFGTFNVTGLNENIFVTNSSIISCAANTTIKIVDLNVDEYPTTCSEYKQCYLTEEQKNSIKRGCNKEKSCSISMIIPSSCLFNDYGHVTISYSCTGTVNYSCTFENEWRGWFIYGFGRYEWTFQHGHTPVADTGPDRDHTTASTSGHYFYTKSSSGSRLNDDTDLISPLILPSPKQCLTFWYHMYGRHINTLKVFQNNSKYNIELWNKSNDQGNMWNVQSLALQSIGSYIIIFKAIRGDGYEGDIAIDDIFIDNTDCNVNKASRFDCNFEVDFCEWKPETKPTYSWRIFSGKTSSDSTGPDVDHTIGSDQTRTALSVKHRMNGALLYLDEFSRTFYYYLLLLLGFKAGGHYIYLEASNVQKGATSMLISDTIYPVDDVCFTFWYHMYGVNMGTLNVYTKSRNITRKHWSRSGNQGNSWNYANFDITSSQPYTIIFEGICGEYFGSDIALDDIIVLQRSCAGLIDYRQSCHKTDESISLTGCSKYYLQLNRTRFVFDREFDNCAAVYQDVQASTRSICNDMNNSDVCTFNLSEVIRKDPKCFQSNRLLVEYNCEERVPDDTHRANVPQDIGMYMKCGLCRKPKENQKNKSVTAGNQSESSVGFTAGNLSESLAGVTVRIQSVSLAGVTTDIQSESLAGVTAHTNNSSNQCIQLKTEHDAIYCQSEEGTYDISGCNRHKEADGNIYSHTVDVVYDSTTLKRNDDDQEDKYDHFIGQKTEDLYDTSMPT